MQKFVVLAERAAVYPTGRGASIFPTLFAGYRPLGSERSGLAKTRVRVTPRVRGEGKGKGENCCGNSNFDFHPKFPPPPQKSFLLSTLYFFEFYNSYVLDLPRFEDHTFAFFKGKCQMYGSSPNVTYLKDCRHIFCNMRDCGRSKIA